MDIFKMIRNIQRAPRHEIEIWFWLFSILLLAVALLSLLLLLLLLCMLLPLLCFFASRFAARRPLFWIFAT